MYDAMNVLIAAGVLAKCHKKEVKFNTESNLRIVESAGKNAESTIMSLKQVQNDIVIALAER